VEAPGRRREASEAALNRSRLPLDDPVAIAGLPETTGRELDRGLQQAVHDGDVDGKLKPYGGIRLWTGLRLRRRPT
jgi:hypothetical protein